MRKPLPAWPANGRARAPRALRPPPRAPRSQRRPECALAACRRADSGFQGFQAPGVADAGAARAAAGAGGGVRSVQRLAD